MFKAVGVKQNMKDVDEIWDSYKLIWVDTDFFILDLHGFSEDFIWRKEAIWSD